MIIIHIKKYGRGCIMNKKEILTIILLICVIFSIQAVSAADGGSNSTDSKVLSASNVSAYALPNSDVGSLAEVANADSFSDLQGQINGASDLTLIKNYTYKSTDTGSVGILIDHDIVIDGKGNVIIDANHKSRIFNITGGKTVTLKGITFINGNADSNGGSITSGGKLTLDNCNFINNTASGHGGAVYLGSSDGDTITNCNFEGNAAGLNGGAVDWYLGSSDGKIIGSNFTSNTAKRSGGAVHWSGHNGTIKDSNFTHNIATGEVIGEIGGIQGGGDGGAVLWVGSNGTVDNCIFVDNFAQYRGGAIFLHGNSTENCTNTTVSNSNFEDNVAGLNGGAIDWQKGAHNGRLVNSNFTNNTAWRSGGAVYWYGINGNITNCDFNGNDAIGNVTGHDKNIVTYETVGGNGGAITWTGSDGIVYKSTFTNNTATNKGGAVYLQGSTQGLCNNTNFDTCTFISNIAGVNGGAIDWYRGARNGHVLNSIFENNIANRSGGAIFWSGIKGEIKNSNFTNNTALGIKEAEDSYGNMTYGGYGGAVIWTGSDGIVDNCKFDSNKAMYNEATVSGGRGGAVYLQGSMQNGEITNCSNTTFTNCEFINNFAGTNGGAIDWHEGAHDGNVYKSTFVRNTAGSNGGAIFWAGHHGEIHDSNFTGNTHRQ